MTRTEKRLDGNDQAGVDSGNTDDLVRDDSIHFDIKHRCGKRISRHLTEHGQADLRKRLATVQAVVW